MWAFLSDIVIVHFSSIIKYWWLECFKICLCKPCFAWVQSSCTDLKILLLNNIKFVSVHKLAGVEVNFGAVLRYVKSCRNLGWQIQDGRYGASVTSFDQNYRCTWVFFTVPSLSRINFKIAHNNQTQVCCQTTSRRRKERGEKQWMSFKHLSFSEAYVCSVTMWSSMHANSFL